MSETISQKRKCAPKFKKAPQAPRRFKSAYMFFSTEQHKHIRDELMADGRCEKTTEIAKLVSQAWKKLSDEDRNRWEEKARQDKARYEVEKSIYSGPWRIPVKKQLQDDPNIPRRPMSAFLAFSHAKRAEVKKKNPELTNAQLSRHLAQLWKEANEEEKREYIDHEYTLRQKYLSDIATWRQVNDKVITEQRNRRENFAMKQVMDGEQNVDPSLLARHPRPSDDSTSHENDKFRSMSSEQGGSWNPYSDYTTAHYNYYPVPTIAGYPPQLDERYAAYPSHPDERYTAYPPHPDERYAAYPSHPDERHAAYPSHLDKPYAAYPPHPDERYAAYPQHPYYDSSTYPAEIAPPLVYSLPGESSPYYSTRNERSEGTEPDVYGHHSDEFRQNGNSVVTSMYQEPGIPFPSPINARDYASHNEYPNNCSEQLPSARIQKETQQKVSSRSYHRSYEYP